MTLPRLRPIRALSAGLVLAMMIGLLPAAPASATVFSGALTLNGTSQYVNMGNTASLKTSQFTLELWFKRTGTGATTTTGTGGITTIIPLITKGRGEGETALQDVNYFLGIDTVTGKLAADFEEAQVAAGGTSPSLNHPILGNTAVTSNVWHHAAATYDGTTWHLYLDGADDGSLFVGRPPNIALTSPTVVGSSLFSTGMTPEGYFAGQVDEVRIWNSARSQAQIQGAMSTELGATPGILGMWHLNEGTGTTANDSAGAATVNNGTLVNAPTWTTSGAPLTGVSTGALTLNGSTQYVTMGSTSSPGLSSSQFTVELWFRRTAPGVGATTGGNGIASAVPLITKGTADGESAAQDINYLLGIDATSGQLVADFEEGPGGAAPSLNHPITGNTVVTMNVWHHAAATYDGNTWHLYLDGADDGSLFVGQPANTGVTSATAIGTGLKTTGATAGFFAGQIDEARIWNSARSQAQIQAAMNTEIGPTNGLLGMWHMNATSGTTVVDGSGNATAINGTVTPTSPAPVWTTGPGLDKSNGLQFNGTSQYVTMGASPGLRSAHFTVETWFRRTGAGVAASTGNGGVNAIPLVTKGHADAETPQADVNYFLGIDSTTNKLVADFEEAQGGGSPSANHPVSGTTTIANNVWYHAAATYDGSTWRLYLNGVLDGSLVVGQPANTAVTTATAIGSALKTDGTAEGFFLGQIDEARIWGVARSQAQIQSAMNAEVSSGSGLLGSWHLNEGTGTMVADSSGSGINGTTFASPTWTYGMLLGAAPANQAPVVDSVSIDQASPHTNDTLTASVSSHDPDGDAVTHTYQWTKNGSDISGATNATLDLSTADNGDATDQIALRVVASDGTLTSAPLTSSPVTILNTAPTATVSLDDHAPGTNATLTATATSSDTDGDGVTLTYVWDVDGVERQTTTTTDLTDTFDLSQPGNGNNGQTVTVTVTPNDGTEDGDPVADSATVGNGTPIVDSVSIDQASPHTGDTLSATLTSHDPDGDALTYDYQWTLNGSDIDGATGDTLDLSTAGNGDRDDVIRVRVTATDGSSTSAPVTSSPVTVLNTAPIATVSLDDHGPGTNATLTATVVASDADGDAVSLTYLWTVDGVTRQTTVTSSLTDAFDLSITGNGDNGQSVVVTVTPNDGTAAGSGSADTAEVGNAAPVVDSVTIDQASPHTNDTLTASIAAHDPDGDAPTYSYQWTLNGSDIDGANAPTLILATAGNGDRGDAIRLRVTASDGTADSAPVTSAPVTVLNTAPSASVALNDHAPGTNATLTATATRSDIDGDTVGLTYVWKVDGTTRQTTSTTAPSDTFDLSQPGNGDGGQGVTVTVTPNDGSLDGTPATDSATVAAGAGAPIFSDDFTAGNFDAWTKVSRMAIDGSTGNPAAPSARADVSGQSAFAYLDLTNTLNQACLSTNVNVQTSGVTVDLLRLRTAANGPLTKLFVHANGNLRIRSEFAGTNFDTGVQLGSGWHEVEMCGIVGTGTSWDVYRDGAHVATWSTDTGSTPIGRIQIGDNTVGTFAVNFDHVVLDLAPGEVSTPDTTPPTTPGQPTGSSTTAGQIQITWAASSDDSPPITYRVYRDGGPASIGSTTDTAFTDMGLAPGSSHTYTIDAVDAVNPGLPSDMSPASASIVVASGTPAIFEDDFSSGFQFWTSVTATMSIDTMTGSPAPASARAQASGSSAYAWHDLDAPLNQVCVSMQANVSSGYGFDLFRLKTAGNGPIVRVVLVNPAQKIQIRADVGGTVINSQVPIGGGWHTLELCGTVGTNTTWDLYRDGVRIVNAWAANTGTTPVGRIQIGDMSTSTFTANYDDVIVDQAPGHAQAPDMTAPTAPGQPSGSSPMPGAIQIGWAASTDDSPPITYRVYRDGGPTSIGSTTATTFTDMGLTPGSSHTYTVDAVDSVNPSLPSGMSSASDAIVVSEGTPALFADDFGSGDFSNWTAVLNLTIDGSIGSAAVPSARANVSAAAAYALRDLGATYGQACFSLNINVASASSAFDIFKLRTALDGPIVRVSVNAAGKLTLRSEVSSTVTNSGILLGTGGWHSIELCGTVGNASSWDLYRDGSPIVTAWVADTGTTPIGMIQLGDRSASTYTANFDDVRLDQAAG